MKETLLRKKRKRNGTERNKRAKIDALCTLQIRGGYKADGRDPLSGPYSAGVRQLWVLLILFYIFLDDNYVKSSILKYSFSNTFFLAESIIMV